VTGSTAGRANRPAATLRPPAASQPAVINEGARRLQFGLFLAGAVLMPLGILAICLGWYGTAHSHYVYDQNTYLISGGLFGLGLVFLGGFMYFGAWLARMSAEQRDNSRSIADAMSVLADALGTGRRIGNGDQNSGTSIAAAAAAAAAAAIAAAGREPAPAPLAAPTPIFETTLAAAPTNRATSDSLTGDDDQLVLAGLGATAHRRDCALIETREDLHAYTPDGTQVTSCRVCRPEI
jgi:subtilisin family serine protease